MTVSAAPPVAGAAFCPFVGLSSFLQAHKDYFFGRELDAAVTADNLLASPVSVLYGSSGVGKSSLVNVGLRQAFETIGIDPTLVICRQWQGAGFFPRLRREIAAQSAMTLANGEQKDLADVIRDIVQRTGRPFALILDQFEEYFLYQHGERAELFEKQLERLARLSNDIDAHIMMGVRDDRLHLLNQLKLRLPDILDNALELHHLDDAAVTKAIVGPIDIYNQRYRRQDDAIKVEPEFVEELKKQLKEADDAAPRRDKNSELIELPYLQLALVKIWQAEGEANATTLTKATLTDKLCGVEQIVRRHLDDVLQEFDPPTQLACARVFDRLVTPSGSKIAYRRGDLTLFSCGPQEQPPRMQTARFWLHWVLSQLPTPVRSSLLLLFGIEETLTGEKLGKVLDLLADDDPDLHQSEHSARRILRSVPSLDDADERSYEIFHDVLAQPIVEWKDRFNAKRDRRRDQLRTLIVSSVASVFLLLFTVAVYQAVRLGQTNEDLRLREIRLLAVASEAQRVAGRSAQAVLLALEALQRELVETKQSTAKTKRALNSALYVNYERLRFDRHRGPVLGIAFSPDGKLLATGSEDGTAIVWYAASGEAVMTFDHGDAVLSVAFNPDGDELATGSKEGTVRIWNLAADRTGADPTVPLAVLDGHERPTKSVAFSPDGRYLATGSEDFTARIWDLATKKSVAIRHQGEVRSVAFDPQGRYLATASEDDRVRIWSLRTYQVVATLEGHKGSVRSVAFDPKGERLVSGSWDGTAMVWDVSHDARQTKPLVLKGHLAFVRSVAFGPHGARVATSSADGTVRLWDLNTGRTVLTLRGHQSEVWSVVFSPDGTRLATASADETARIWDLEQNEAVTTLVGHDERVWNVAFSPDGKQLATASGDNSVRIWDIETGQTVRTLNIHRGSVRAVAFSPNGGFMATGSSDKTVRLVDLHDSQIRTLGRHGDVVRSVVFDPDGERLATSSDDKTAIVWDLETGRQLAVLKGHGEPVRSVAFSPDGKTLATGGADFTARIWDAQTGKEVAILEEHLGEVQSVAFSPDGKRLATSSRDSTVIIWDAQTAQSTVRLSGHRGAVLSVAFSSDGKTLATASIDRTAFIWDLETGQIIASLEGHSAPVRSVFFSRDDRLLATGADDTTARIWRFFEEVPALISFARKQVQGLPGRETRSSPARR